MWQSGNFNINQIFDNIWKLLALILLKGYPPEIHFIIFMNEWHDICDLFQNYLGCEWRGKWNMTGLGG